MACGSDVSRGDVGQFDFHEVRRAARDARNAQRIDLNGLRCLLVSDPSQRLASFSLCVSCGLADGCEVAALQEAIRASERFTRFEDFIKLNNGAVYPADVRVDHTVYGFEVHQSALTLAAVKFAEVIAAGELGSVAGRKLSFSNVYARNPENEVLAGLLGREHPFSKLLAVFQQQSVSLSDSGLEEKFRRFYNAHQSSLELSGCQSIAELAAIAEKFARIFSSGKSSPDRGSLTATSTEDCQIANEVSDQTVEFPRSALRKLVIVNSDVESKLIVTWPLRTESLGGYRCKPLHFVSYLLQQDRSGGLLNYLKREGLVSDIQVVIPENELESNRRWKLYRVVLMVTTLGVERRHDVVAALISYLVYIQTNEIQQWIYDEAATSCRLAYEFAEHATESRVNASMNLAVRRVSPEDCFLGDRLMLAFDEQCIHRTMNALVQGSYSVILEGDFDAASFSKIDLVEDFGLVTSLPEVVGVDDTKFAAYTRNPLMPENLTIQEESIYLEDYPNVIEKGNSYRLWYQFKSVGLPKTYCHVHMFTGQTNSPEGFTRAEIACAALERLVCNRESDSAGFEFSTSTRTSGISFVLSGFNDKFARFLAQIISYITDFSITGELFRECHQAVVESYQFRSSNAAYAENVFTQLYSGQLDLRQCQAAAEAAEFDSVQRIFADVRNSCHVECLVYGNSSAQDAIGLIGIVKAITAAADNVIRPTPHSLNIERLRDEHRVTVSQDQRGETTAVWYYHRNSEDDNGAEVLIDILVHLLERQLHFADASTCYLPRSCNGVTTGFTLEVTSRLDAAVIKTLSSLEKAIPEAAAQLAESSQLESLVKSTKVELRRRRGAARQLFAGSGSHYQMCEAGVYQTTMADEAGSVFDEIREQRFRFGASALYGEVLQILEAEDFRAWLHEALESGWLRRPLTKIRVG